MGKQPLQRTARRSSLAKTLAEDGLVNPPDSEPAFCLSCYMTGLQHRVHLTLGTPLYYNYNSIIFNISL